MFNKVDDWEDRGGENEGENISEGHEVGAGEEGNGPLGGVHQRRYH
jgi:hypothetical protein